MPEKSMLKYFNLQKIDCSKTVNRDLCPPVSSESSNLSAIQSAVTTADSELHKTVLSKIITTDFKQKPFKCSDCDYCTGIKSDLVRHIKSVHLKLKPFSCSECDYRACKRSSLARHMKSIHSILIPTSSSVTSNDLELDLLVSSKIIVLHSKERPFKCSDCKYSAAARKDLVIHIKSWARKTYYRVNELKLETILRIRCIFKKFNVGRN